MTLFCLICRELIPENRQRRGWHTCSTPCHREFKRQKRLERNSRVCKVCGRQKLKERKSRERNGVPQVLQAMAAKVGG